MWVRTPWQADGKGGLAPVISDALLDAVAVPQHVPLRLSLRFAASPPVERVSTLLAGCGYVTMALEMQEETLLAAAVSAVELNDADTTPSAPAPPVIQFPSQFTAELYEDLERVVAGRDVNLETSASWLPQVAGCWSALRYEARIAALHDFAEFLQAPAPALASLRAAGAGGGRNRGDQMRIDRDWALNCIAAARDAEAGRVVSVDAALAATLLHVPLLPGAPHDARWVLHQGPRARATMPPGTPVLVRDPAAAAEAKLPRFVREALRREVGHLALAGGAALAAVTAAGTPADYDLYVMGLTGSADNIAAAADALVRRVVERGPGVVGGARGAVVSRSAVTLRVMRDPGDDPDAVAPEFIVQFVLRVAKDPADILSGFDLAPSTVLVEASSADNAPLAVLAAPDWVLAMRHGAYVLDGRAWSRATALRVFKYAAKGFDGLVPALRNRAALRFSVAGNQQGRWSWWSREEDKMKHLDGFELLFAIERYIVKRIETEARQRSRQSGVQRELPRISAQDVQHAAAHLQLAQRTDYAMALKTMNRFIRFLTEASAEALRRIGAAAPSDALAGAPLGWRQPWSRAQFHPVLADITDALQLTDAAP